MKVYMLIGVPGSGKSTYREQILGRYHQLEKPHVYSTDDHIEKLSAEAGLTYSEGFDRFYKQALAHENDALNRAIKMQQDVIWDQTNLTKSSRAKKMARFPKGTEFVAFVSRIPEEKELQRRLDSRKGKAIPDHVMELMKKQFYDNPVEMSEGFSDVVYAE